MRNKMQKPIWWSAYIVIITFYSIGTLLDNGFEKFF